MHRLLLQATWIPCSISLQQLKKIRREDDYSPGGEAGHRPDRATLVYSNRMKEAFRDVPLIIGGIEASLRRFWAL